MWLHSGTGQAQLFYDKDSRQLPGDRESQSIQYRNKTSALPELQDDYRRDQESAPDLARKLNENPLGNYGYYETREAVEEEALPALEPAPALSETTATETVVQPEEPAQPTTTAPSVALSTPEGESLATVALLLPLTGAAAPAAKSMQNAVEMAVFDARESKEFITILPLDTRGTAEGAISAAQAALDQKADIILGPLFNHTSKAIADMARDKGVPVVSFSNDPTLVESGVYVLGSNLKSQIERVVDVAYSKGTRNFSGLVPDSDYGVLTIDAMNEALKRRNLGVKSVEYYGEIDEKVSQAIQRLTFVDPSLPPPKEFSTGLVLPEGGRTLMTLIARLHRKDVKSDHLRLLGSAVWDDELIINEARLNGGWFATNSPDKQQAFKERFRQMFGYDPLNISSLAYDGVMMAIALGKQTGPERFSRKALTDPMGFVGTNGIFRFTKEGMVERALAVVEISKGQLKVIDPAPTVFPSTFDTLPPL